MDARDHLNNQIIEIIEELANRRKGRSFQNPQQNANENIQAADNKVDLSISDQGNILTNQEQKNNLTIDPNSLKSLLAARHNLDSLRERLNKDPEKKMTEIEKLNKVELKLNSSINKARQTEIKLALDDLKREPRRYVIKLADTKSKIELLKTKLESNPRLYKIHMSKLENFEKVIDKKIDTAQVKTLRSAIKHIQNNPEKYRQEIDKYDEMEKTLNRALSQNNQKEMKQVKGNEKTQKQERTKTDLELSR